MIHTVNYNHRACRKLRRIVHGFQNLSSNTEALLSLGEILLLQKAMSGNGTGKSPHPLSQRQVTHQHIVIALSWTVPLSATIDLFGIPP